MTTWTLWIGAVLVVGGSAAHLTRQAVAARALWVLAVLAFVATVVGAVIVSEVSLPLLLILGVAIAATVALVSVTRQPAQPVTRESAQSGTRKSAQSGTRRSARSVAVRRDAQ